jgi:probable rRNA maturation factor
MRALNKRYRNLDRVTDVLSFPADAYPHQDQSSARVLGDIVIATGVAKRQARAVGVSVDMEIRRLALHGLLHLMGYDHETDTGQMSRLERRLLRIGGMAELSI